MVMTMGNIDLESSGGHIRRHRSLTVWHDNGDCEDSNVDNRAARLIIFCNLVSDPHVICT